MKCFLHITSTTIFFILVNDDEESEEQPSALTVETSDAPTHPRHRVIRDMPESADFSSFNYSADVAHLFKENRHSGLTDDGSNLQFRDYDGKFIFIVCNVEIFTLLTVKETLFDDVDFNTIVTSKSTVKSVYL